ncbi:putative OTU domain-containing protein [Hibiscus syriacus]|uniref:OTU domain-containing protein n=1 Tax=Hibiscus syriacus TaxID=106335 RepID=A0A6A3AQS2_HIBSY|nr:filament-like plant protein 7 [Hibiscus syriacus]KAE8707050.1 putative OTU domain-containing protein [Hibiscus syriacus]
MDQKIWLWKKKSTEKTSLSTHKLNISQKDNVEEIQTFVTDKRELENELNKLNHKLASALSDCNYKDELVKKHENTALQATAGREKAESRAASLKQELDEALQQRVASEERVTNLDAALKECMRQLRFVRQEQEQRIHDAVINASKEFEKSKNNLEEQLADTRKRVAKLGVKNTNLSKALLAKENVIDDLNKQRARIETNLSALLIRLESTEKYNAALKYEVRVHEKELEIWNEEREFNRRTSEASHKQHLESVKKIAKLESECQRLRILVRKRLPGPDALAKMKNEVEMLGKGSIEIRMRKLNQSPTSVGVDFAVDSYSDSPSKRVNTLTEQLCAIEEENMALKEALNKKTSELQFSRAMYARAASKLSDVESRLEESSKSLSNNESTRNNIKLSSMYDVGIDDKASSAESLASTLISELEHFKNGQIRNSSSRKTVVSSEINLMDDFVEMEKLALVSIDKQSESSHVSSDEAHGTLGPLQTGLNGNALEVMCKETVLVPDSWYDHSMLNNEMKSKSLLVSKVPGPLQDIREANLEQTNATQRNPDGMLEDIRRGLACMGYPNAAESIDENEGLDRHNSSDPSCISGYMSWKSLNSSSKVDSCNEDADVNICSEEVGNQRLHPDLTESICRIIELIEGISLPPPDYNIPEKNSFPYKHKETPGYVVRVFQWKTSEIGAVLHQFVQACYDLLNGKADINKFTQELTSGLDWIINHCFSLQDVSIMRDAIKNHFDWDESERNSEVEGGIVDQFAQPEKFDVAALYDNEESSMREEKIKPRDELVNEEATKHHVEEKIQSTMNMSNSLINQLEESEKAIEKLQVELDTLRKTEEMVEVKVEKQMWINGIYDNPLSLTKYRTDEACQNFPSQDLKSKINNSGHEDFETACLDSVTEKERPKSEIEQEGNQFRTEITIASENLAECQETILNLGKQLKALASPKEAAIFDNIISAQNEIITPTTLITIPTPPRKKLISRRPFLLDQMITEDKAKVKGNPSSSFISKAALSLSSTDSTLVLNGNKQQEDNAAVKSLAIVPSKKQGGNLWKKLFRRKGFGC